MALGITTRFLVDTVSQIFNPFLTIFASGLGISAVTLGQLLGLRSIMGLTAPAIGAMADQYGYRRMMQIMLLFMVVGTLLIGSSPGLPLAIPGIILMGIGLAGFVPTLHAYLSARLPYAKRARGLGMLEYSWALAGIFGLYLVGQLIAISHWRVPLFVLAAGLAVMLVALGTLPPVQVQPGHSPTLFPPSKSVDRPLARLRAFFRLGERARSAYAAIIADMLLFFAGMQLFVTYGAWLNLDYGLGAAALGTVALILGCFDLLASITVSLFTDRIGKLRSVILGTAGVLLGYAMLPFLNHSLIGAVIGIAFTRTAFEFGLVSQISLISEQLPAQRGKMISLAAAFVLSGGTIASLAGPWLYTTQGITALCWTGIGATALALVLLITQVDEGAESEG